MLEPATPLTAARLIQRRAAWAWRSQLAWGIAVLGFARRVGSLNTPGDEWIPRARSHRASCSPGALLLHHILSPCLLLGSCLCTAPLCSPPAPCYLPLATPPPAPGTELLNLADLFGSSRALLCRDPPSGCACLSLLSPQGAEMANLHLDLEFLHF